VFRRPYEWGHKGYIARHGAFSFGGARGCRAALQDLKQHLRAVYPPREMSSRKTSDLAEWYASQYAGAVGLSDVEGGARFKQFVEQFPLRSDSPTAAYPMTGRQRMSNFLSLKLRYPLGAAGYTCLAMAAKVGEHAANYAYAYWRRGHERGGPEYICVSPTFDSRDGEYRRRFIRYPVFAAACDKLVKSLAPFEEATLAMVGDRRLELKSVAYPEESAEGIIGNADELRLPVVAFAVALLLDLFETERGMLMAHTSAAYSALMRTIAAEQPSLVKLSTANVLNIDALTMLRRGSQDIATVQCGQKIVPMFVREVVQAADYNLAVWRELAVSRLAGDLVLNYVSPSFAFYNQWTYIEGADPALFENAAMEERYVRGSAVAEAARSLREARRTLGSAQQNYHTEALSAQLYESLEYAQSFLLMSPIALVHTMEDVGWALRSLSAYVRRAPTQWPAAEDAFADADMATRHLFEFAYGAHCLHTKVGAAHTDLHGNNLTFYMWGLADREKADGKTVTYEPFYDDPVVAYVTGPRGEADTYVFPAAGDSGCIVDYSRCILGPAFRPHLEEGRSPRYATNFYRDQVNRVMRTLFRYASSYVERHQEAIKATVLANFEAVFPILCAVDFIAIGRNVGAALHEAISQADEGELRPFKVSRAALELAARLEVAAQEVFITGLHDLAESAGARRQMRTPDFPGPALFEKVFGEWLFPRWAAREPRRVKTAQLVDAYNYNNPLRHSGADYAKYLPWARFDEIERHLGEYKLTDLFERGVEPFLEALRPNARVEVIAERLRAAQEKRDGAAVSTASSWLDE